MAENTEDATVDNELVTENNEQFPEIEVDNETIEEIKIPINAMYKMDPIFVRSTLVT